MSDGKAPEPEYRLLDGPLPPVAAQNSCGNGAATGGSGLPAELYSTLVFPSTASDGDWFSGTKIVKALVSRRNWV